MKKRTQPEPARRRALDAYYSDRLALGGLLSKCPAIGGELALDPSSGDGSMARRLRRIFPRVLTNDIDPMVRADSHLDAAAAELYSPAPDWVITNPPAAAGGDIAAAALAAARRGVALLLRLSFLEACGPSHLCRRRRRSCAEAQCMRNGRLWLPSKPPTQLIALPRYSFTRDGRCDSVTMAWFVWRFDSKRRLVDGGIRSIGRDG